MVDVNKVEKSVDRIRVALVITELAVGGAERAMYELATRLDRARFTPTVFSLSVRARDVANSLAPSLRAFGVETIELGGRSAFDFLAVARRLRAALQDGQFDVLQSFMYHANIVGRFAGRWAGVPLVCSGIRVAERDGRLRLAFDRWTRGLVDAWICVGESVASFTRAAGGIPGDRVYSIPNGVFISPDDLTKRSDSEVPPPFGRGRKRMIAVGRLSRQKGFDELLQGARDWFTAELARDWELWLVGDGEDRSKLASLIEVGGLSDRVYLAGWRSDVRRLVAESDLFLLPSRWEGMPNALLEACALGKACLCRDVEGVGEILGASRAEQTSADASGAEWRSRLARFIEDADLRERLGESNGARVRAEFSLDSTARRYERLWLELLARKDGRFTEMSGVAPNSADGVE